MLSHPVLGPVMFAGVERGWSAIATAAGLALLTWVACRARADESAPVDETSWVAVVTAYEADASCPSRSELEARIRALVRQPTQTIQARVAIDALEGAFEARVEVLDGATSAVRTLHGHECSALASTVALVIAMVIDPSAAERAAAAERQGESEGESDVESDLESEGESDLESESDVEVEGESEGEGESESEGESEGESDVEVETPPESASALAAGEPESLEVAFIAELFFVGSAGLLPSPSYGGTGLAGIRVERLEVARGATLLVESRATLTSTRGGDFALALGRLRVGYAFDLRPLEIAPSIALDVGATWGRGYGVVRPGAGTALSIDVALGLEARAFFLPELGVALFAELDVPLLRPDFVFTGIAPSPVFRASEVGTIFGLGLVLLSG